MTKVIQRTLARSSLLARLIESPDLARAVSELPAPAFSALVRNVGVEDAGEIVALATTPQIVAAFDEDLFTNDAPGERETFDARRFVTWLEVLLEAGDNVAAARFVELGEDFVARALSSLLLVLDNDALLERFSEGGYDVDVAEKAIESALSEEIDGYLLVSRNQEGWDAALSLILALDRDHRAFLERVLDRGAAVTRGLVDDLDELVTVLSEEESLAEDVEGERDERRGQAGYVEPRAARSFLALAQKPMEPGATTRDPVTKAYFRELAPPPVTKAPAASVTKLMGMIADVEAPPPAAPAPRLAAGKKSARSTSVSAPLTNTPSVNASKTPAIAEAMRLLAEASNATYNGRLEELAYLTNVLVAAVGQGGERLRPAQAAEAVLATVGLGAELVAREQRSSSRAAPRRATPAELADVVREIPADILFRRASSAIAASGAKTAIRGITRDAREVDVILKKMLVKPSPR